jgi:hypothetical protein
MNPIGDIKSLMVNYALITDKPEMGEYTKQKKLNGVTSLLEEERAYATDMTTKYADSVAAN